MTTARIEGVVPILVTPFFDDGRIDEESLARLIEYNVAAGIQGLGVAIGSEIFKLTEAERQQMTRAVVRLVNGRVPVIINTGATGTDIAVHYARLAADAGADALMIMPPTFFAVGAQEILDYYKAISAAVSVPLILQDIPQAPISPALALRIADACPTVTHIKVETVPLTQKVADMAAAVGDRLVVFGGAGGGYFIEELRRGARGTMPFCSQPAAFLAVWNKVNAGDIPGAREIFDRAFTGINRLSNQNADLFFHVHKHLLVRMGIIRTPTVRSPSIPLDPITRKEIDEVLTQLVPEPVPFGS